MPSGAKKRRAAKKKEQQANNNSLPLNGNNPQGHDDAKSQDDRGSDGGEIDSPVSQGSQNHQDPFSSNAEENGKSDTSLVHLMDAERKTLEEIKKDEVTTEVLGNEDGVDIKIEKAMEPEDENGGGSDKIPIVDGSGRSSSSNSSSDDESQLSTKNVEEQVYEPVSEATLYSSENKKDYSMSGKVVPVTGNSALLESDHSSVVETASNTDLVQPVLSMSEEVVRATEDSPLTAAVVSDTVESGRKENEERMRDSSISTGTQLEKNKFPTSDTLAPESNEIARETKETGIPDATDKELAVGFAPSVRRRTSVFSCCGLFDVFENSRE